MFAWGVTMWELCNLKSPVGGIGSVNIPKKYPAELRNLISRALNPQPGLRPGAQEVVDILRPVLDKQRQEISSAVSSQLFLLGSKQDLHRNEVPLAPREPEQTYQRGFDSGQSYQRPTQMSYAAHSSSIPQQYTIKGSKESMMSPGAWVCCFFFCCPVAACLKLCEMCEDQ